MKLTTFATETDFLQQLQDMALAHSQAENSEILPGVITPVVLEEKGFELGIKTLSQDKTIVQDQSLSISTIPTPTNVSSAHSFSKETAASPELYSFITTNTINGTEGNDTIYGNSQFAWTPEHGTIITFKDDIIHGLDGNDIIYGQGGDDIIYGGEGNDQIFGGYGNDFLTGSSENGFAGGRDSLTGGQGADRFQWTSASYLDNGSQTATLDLGPNDMIVQGLNSYFVIWDFNTAEGDSLDFNLNGITIANAQNLGLGSSDTDAVFLRETSYSTGNEFIEYYDVIGVVVDWTAGV